MFKYLVRFAHEDDTQPENSEERHGAGQIEIETDEEVTRQEHLVEIARTIGNKNGYTKVGITDIKQVVEDDSEEGDS